MQFNLKIENITQWEHSDYEGQIDGLIDEYPVTCHVFFHSKQEWKKYNKGDHIFVNMWMERLGDVKIVDKLAKKEFRHIENTQYEIAGTILKAEGETVVLNSTFPILVDLDFPFPKQSNCITFSKNVNLKITGVLKIEIEHEN